MRSGLKFALGATALVLTACSNQAPSPGDDVLGLEPAASNVRCIVNAYGTLPDGDRFAAHANDFRDGSSVGHVIHLTGDDVFQGSVSQSDCFINGSSLAVLLGDGRWNGEPGYTFTVAATHDAPDEYEFTVYDTMSNLIYQSPTSVPGNVPTSGDIVVEGF